MTIIECINEKTALNLNPFQVFVFLNQKTKKFENRLRLLANRQQSFNVVFVDDDPRSHIQTSYWSDFENIKVTVMHRKVELRSIRLPKENIVIHVMDYDELNMPAYMRRDYLE